MKRGRITEAFSRALPNQEPTHSRILHEHRWQQHSSSATDRELSGRAVLGAACGCRKSTREERCKLVCAIKSQLQLPRDSFAFLNIQYIRSR